MCSTSAMVAVVAHPADGHKPNYRWLPELKKIDKIVVWPTIGSAPNGPCREIWL